MFLSPEKGRLLLFLLFWTGGRWIGWCSWCCTWEVFGREKGRQFEGRGGRGIHFGVFLGGLK